VTTLGFLASRVLCEKGLSDLPEVVERAMWQGVELLRCSAPSGLREGKTYRVVAGVEHHLVSKVSDVLN